MKKIFLNKKLWCVFWAAGAALCMMVIFYMSHQPATESAKMSGIITECLMEMGVGKESAEKVETCVRKSAHFLEYFGLSLCIGLYIFIKKGRLRKKDAVAVIMFCMLYAITDEVHQLFIDGRAGRVTDVMIDTLGSAVAAAILLACNMVIRFIKHV